VLSPLLRHSEDPFLGNLGVLSRSEMGRIVSEAAWIV
jgi:hypothetical protein